MKLPHQYVLSGVQFASHQVGEARRQIKEHHALPDPIKDQGLEVNRTYVHNGTNWEPVSEVNGPVDQAKASQVQAKRRGNQAKLAG